MLRRLLPPATGLGTALLAVCVNIVLTGCTTLSPRLDAEPASIAPRACSTHRDRRGSPGPSRSATAAWRRRITRGT